MSGKYLDTLTPFVVAIGLGALAVFAAPAALLTLSALGAYVLARRGESVDLVSFVGPLFATLIVGAFVGFAGAIGVLFVWRLSADTRWSVREAQRLARAAGRPAEASWRSLIHAWATPVYGLALVAYTAPHMIAGLPLDLPHVPLFIPLIAGAIAAGAFFDWSLRRAADWRLGELAPAPALHLLLHHAVFLFAYGLDLDVSAGVVALLAWRMAHAAPLPGLRMQNSELRTARLISGV